MSNNYIYNIYIYSFFCKYSCVDCLKLSTLLPQKLKQILFFESIEI